MAATKSKPVYKPEIVCVDAAGAIPACKVVALLSLIKDKAAGVCFLPETTATSATGADDGGKTESDGAKAVRRMAHGIAK